ncbi:hypothetical protein HN698_02450, partial [Candidatus Woesearchaeota archaeon]|nr:hypothetical protein [Candidatus Woesearchaeota archaeon]
MNKILLTVIIGMFLFVPFVTAFNFPQDDISVTTYFGNLTNLHQLNDTNIVNPTNLQLLQYQTGDNKWHPYSFVLGDWWDYDYADLINEPTALSDFSDDLGDRGYIDLLNFTNSPGFYNATDFSIGDYLTTATASTTYATIDEPLWTNNSTDVAFTNINETFENNLYIQGNNLSLGSSEGDSSIWFYDNSGLNERLWWDESDGRFELTHDFSIGSAQFNAGGGYFTSSVISQSDFHTTGEGDDLWLGDNTQADALFQAYANGSLVIKNLVVTDGFIAEEALWNANYSDYLTLFNWNKTYADTLYYGISNPNGYYNSTSNIGNWTEDKGDYYTSTEVDGLDLSNFNNDLNIGNWTADKGDYYTSAETDTEISNANTSINNWANSIFARNDGDNLTGQYDFNGGWTSNGISIINGDGYFQTVYAYNYTGLNVGTVATNGSLLPTIDNSFDLGNQTFRWKDLHLSNDAYIAGDVGIGVTSPSSKLQIEGDVLIKSGEYLSWGTAGQTAIEGSTVSNKIDFKTNGISRLYLASGGNVGIGTASPAEKLDIVGGNVILDSTYGYYGSWVQAISAAGLKIGNDDYSGYMFFHDDGNVGIGTTSPGAKLDVQLASGGGPAIRIMNTAVNEGWMWYPVTNGANTDLRLYEYNSGGDSDRITYQAGGNVGIGTNSPGAKLDVFGNIKFTAGYTLDSAHKIIYNTVTGQGHEFRVNDADKVIIDSTGNVGIGTASPATLLHVRPSTGAGIIAVDSVNGHSMYKMFDNGTERWAIYNDVTTDDLYFREDGSDQRLVIQEGGNVGIGTTSPDDELSVVGTVNATAFVCADGTNDCI